MFLPVVHLDHLIPVGGDLRQAEMTAEIDEVEHVFLEAGAAKAHRGLQKLWPNARVGANGPGDFIHISTGFFAKG